MEFIFTSLPRFNKRQHRISEWLAKLEQRFVLADVGEDARKIKFCQVFIGKTGEEREDTANRQALEAFVCALDPKLVLEVQKLGHLALDNVIATARHIKCLQKGFPSPNMNNLVTVLKEELLTIRKELKESSVAAADKAVRDAQPAAMILEPADPTAGRYVAPAAGARALLVAAGASCATRRDISLHHAPSGLKCSGICNSKRDGATAPPAWCALPPTPPAEGMVDEDGSVSLRLSVLEKSTFFKEPMSFEAKGKKETNKIKTNKHLTLSYKNYLQN